MGRQERAVVALAAVAPWPAGVVLVPLRDQLTRTNAALVLVVVVVAAAASGSRPAGASAALSAGGCFDFLLTRPYQSFSITARDDVATALLLVVVGLAVSELAVRGQRQRARSTRAEAYLEGLRAALETLADDAPPDVLVERIRERLVVTLDLTGCRFEPGPAPAGRFPRLGRDGEVAVEGAVCDIRHFGLPVNRPIELPVGTGEAAVGRYWLQARPGARPGPAERLVAVALADRAATALAARSGRATPGAGAGAGAGVDAGTPG